MCVHLRARVESFYLFFSLEHVGELCTISLIEEVRQIQHTHTEGHLLHSRLFREMTTTKPTPRKPRPLPGHGR
jgi:hypothetical protein